MLGIICLFIFVITLIKRKRQKVLIKFAIQSPDDSFYLKKHSVFDSKQFYNDSLITKLGYNEYQTNLYQKNKQKLFSDLYSINDNTFKNSFTK